MKRVKVYCNECGAEINWLGKGFFTTSTSYIVGGTQWFLDNPELLYDVLYKVEEEGVFTFAQITRLSSGELFKYLKDKSYAEKFAATMALYKVIDKLERIFRDKRIPNDILLSKDCMFIFERACRGYLKISNIEYGENGGEYCKKKYIKSMDIGKGELFDEWYEKEWPFVKSLDETCPICMQTKGLHRGECEPKELVQQEYSEMLKLCEAKVSTEHVSCEDISAVDIILYLKHLVAIENSIRFYEDRLLDLLCQRKNISTRKIYDDKVVSRKLKGKYSRKECIDDELSRLERIIQEVESGNFPKMDYLMKKYNLTQPKNLECPLKPLIAEPVEPELAKENIFNRAKVRKENENLIANYNRQKEEYNRIWSQYQVEKRKYEIDQNNVMKMEQALQTEIAENSSEALNRKKTSLLVEREVISKEISNANTEKYYDVLFNIMQEEIEEIKRNLVDLMQVRQKMHSIGLVFPKYLEYVSIITMLEYFESGRCCSLTGAAGAYNLYENELRQDIIIGKLDNIIDKLDMIERNQYLLYASLQDIEKGINKLSTQFNQFNECAEKICASLQNIEKSTEEIKKSSEYTAYYSAKTAEYSKRNVELTNALGYLVAFK